MRTLFLYLAAVFALQAQNEARPTLLGPLLASNPSECETEISRLVKDYQQKPNPQLIEEVNEELIRSINKSYSSKNRNSITELASELSDPTSLPILISHLAYRDPSAIMLISLGFAGFQEFHPYAAAVASFRFESSLPALLDAVASSTDPAFDQMAEATVDFMNKQTVFTLLDRYQVSPENSKIAKFITICFAEKARGKEGIQYVEDRIAVTHDPTELARLQKLGFDLQDPQFNVDLMHRRPAWP